MPRKPRREADSSHLYLSEISPKDKPWDKHKLEAGKVKDLYEGTMFDSYAKRIKECSGFLGFKWVVDSVGLLKLMLSACRFCRVRHCPVCQWRRVLMWLARFLGALPAIVRDYPKAKYVFLTLTVENCELTDLRDTIARMNKAWDRMSKRKAFPAIGYARSTEVTKAKDGKAHPHFHALLMVPSSYFKGKLYLTQAEWTELWKSCLKVDYTPIVNVKAVKNRRRRTQSQNGMNLPLDSSNASETILAASDEISSGVVEVFKYSVKPEDLIGTGSEADRQWLVELTNQLYKTRAIALGGIFKNYLSENEPENLIGNDDEETNKISDIYFGWREELARYIDVK